MLVTSFRSIWYWIRRLIRACKLKSDQIDFDSFYAELREDAELLAGKDDQLPDPSGLDLISDKEERTFHSVVDKLDLKWEGPLPSVPHRSERTWRGWKRTPQMEYDGYEPPVGYLATLNTLMPFFGFSQCREYSRNGFDVTARIDLRLSGDEWCEYHHIQLSNSKYIVHFCPESGAILHVAARTVHNPTKSHCQ